MMTTPSKRDLLLEFIDKYRSLPELWDTTSVSYSNRIKKAQAYDVLIETLKPLEPDATRESVVKKINNLRSVFRKELKKVNESKLLGNVYVPSLWYFEDLMFLVDHETNDVSEATSNGRSNSNNEVSVVSSSPSTSANFYAQSSRKRKTAPSVQDFLLKATRYLGSEDDEFLTLAKGYAVKLRKLTPEQLMFADKVINETLFDAQMGLLTRGSCVMHPSSRLSTPSPPPTSKSYDEC